jgi:hypothetical protein
MSGSEIQGRRRWWQFLSKPAKACQALYDHGPATFNLLVIFLGGIVMFQTWATAFHLGDDFVPGKIMTVTLILGPVAGLLIAIAGAMFAVNLGCLLDSSHNPSFKYRGYIPPFPMKNLLWKRIIGKEKLELAFQKTPLSIYGKAWSQFRSALDYLYRQLSGGRVSFGQLFSILSANMSVLVFVALGMVVELAMGDGSHFSSQGGGFDIWLLVKVLFVVWFFALWFPMLKVGFQLPVARAVLATIISAGLTLVVTLLLLIAIFKLPVLGV